jgi:hypothetical protein
MDYDNPRFVAAVKKVLIDWINKTETKMNDFDSNDQQRDTERDVKQPPPPLERTDSAIHDPASSHQTKKEEPNWPQRIEAVCAVLLVVITGFYTYYAARQLHKMKRSTEAAEKAANAATSAADTAARQLDDAELRESARLTFQEIKATIVPGKDFVVDVSVTIVNSGPTVADDLSFKQQSASPSLENNPNPIPATPGQTPANPSTAGPSLAYGQTKTYKYRDGGTDRVTAGKDMFLLIPSISYRDIFGCAHRTTDCLAYDPRIKDWISCPTLHQHNRQEPCHGKPE